MKYIICRRFPAVSQQKPFGHLQSLEFKAFGTHGKVFTLYTLYTLYQHLKVCGGWPVETFQNLNNLNQLFKLYRF